MIISLFQPSRAEEASSRMIISQAHLPMWAHPTMTLPGFGSGQTRRICSGPTRVTVGEEPSKYNRHKGDDREVGPLLWRRKRVTRHGVGPVRSPFVTTVRLILWNITTTFVAFTKSFRRLSLCAMIYVDGRTYCPNDRGDNADTLPAVEPHCSLRGREGPPTFPSLNALT
jgi:hypothetical protein